jgi:eukaryotic-like serine/threonine-protein kinase
MHELDPDRWRAVNPRLKEALELPEEELAPWMAALREQDPLLAEDVRVLLEEFEIVRREHFLEGDHAFAPAGAVEDVAAADNGPFAGRVFGAYRLVSPIGRGGMGVVWLAERCDGQFEGRAAVKLLDIVRFGKAEARFRREANILAPVTTPTSRTCSTRGSPRTASRTWSSSSSTDNPSIDIATIARSTCHRAWH